MRARWSLLLLIPGALLIAAARADSGNDSVREVRFYEPRFYDGADVPFSVSSPEILSKDVVTEEWIRQTALAKKAIVEVCVLIQDPVTKVWRGPRGFAERKRHCSAYR